MRALLVCSVILSAVTLPCVLVAEIPNDHPVPTDGDVVSIPTIQLSMQEWGVWQLDARGEVRSLEAVARESPAFVHRQTGVPASAPPLPPVPPRNLPGVPNNQVFDKPVVFFFAQRPMDLTVTVRVPNGRPWLYYPNATLGRVQGDEAIRFHGRLFGQQDPLPTGVAFPAPPNGHWWQFLRGVGASAFVSTEGREAERFLFYDGQAPFERGFARRGNVVRPISPNVDLLAWVVDGRRSARLVMQAGAVTRTPLVSLGVLPGELRARLIRRGLSGPIADALIATWRAELFESRDRRVIWLLTEAAYDAMLPIEVVPAPQYRCRVGVVIEKF